jgi:hypothetical protein
MKIKVFNKSMINITIQGVVINSLKYSREFDMDQDEIDSLSNRTDITLMHVSDSTGDDTIKDIQSPKTTKKTTRSKSDEL